MTVHEFIEYWNKEYPEAFPINHELKSIYKDRWFRIHSLPNLKRYAETENEYKIILDRQNQLIEDLIGEGTEIAIIFGLYTDELTNDNYKELTDFGEFQKVLTIDLHRNVLMNMSVKCTLTFSLNLKNGKRIKKMKF